MHRRSPAIVFVFSLCAYECSSGTEPPSDYKLGYSEGCYEPERMHQERPFVGEMMMDVGDEFGYVPNAEGESLDCQSGVTDGYFSRRGKIDEAQDSSRSERIDHLFE